MAEQIPRRSGGAHYLNTHQRTTVHPMPPVPADGREQRRAALVETRADRPGQPAPVVLAVVPAYNEDRFIGSVVLKTRPFVDGVTVIDDGSSDDTAAVASRAGAEVILHPHNQGKATALKTGFARALELGAEIVVILDADGQHNPEEIPLVIRPILRGEADMVIGSRFQEKHSRIPGWRRLGQHSLTVATNVASGTNFSDSQSGFRALSCQALRAIDIRSNGFAVESEMQFWAQEHGLRVVEVPISCVYVENSKRNPFGHGLQVLGGIIDLVSQSRPLLFFGAAGLLLTALGTGWWCWIVEIYSRTGELALGYALLATLLIIVGALAAFQGITLHILRQMMQRLADHSASNGYNDNGKVALVRTERTFDVTERPKGSS
jgi:glycosyltransferase involved in cell wall biosynthesis